MLTQRLSAVANTTGKSWRRLPRSLALPRDASCMPAAFDRRKTLKKNVVREF